MTIRPAASWQPLFVEATARSGVRYWEIADGRTRQAAIHSPLATSAPNWPLVLVSRSVYHANFTPKRTTRGGSTETGHW